MQSNMSDVERELAGARKHLRDIRTAVNHVENHLRIIELGTVR
jgi:hypothetical protein